MHTGTLKQALKLNLWIRRNLIWFEKLRTGNAASNKPNDLLYRTSDTTKWVDIPKIAKAQTGHHPSKNACLPPRSAWTKNKRFVVLGRPLSVKSMSKMLLAKPVVVIKCGMVCTLKSVAQALFDGSPTKWNTAAKVKLIQLRSKTERGKSCVWQGGNLDQTETCEWKM